MASCEMCGKQAMLKKARVAGALMSICSQCEHLGLVVEKQDMSHTFRRNLSSGPQEVVIENFVSKLQSGMAKKKLDVHVLARAINIRESTLTLLLQGKLHADVETAKKIGKYFEFTATEFTSATDFEPLVLKDEEKGAGFTLGDLIKNAKTKK